MQERDGGATDVWRCSVCKKTKPLMGPHLDGKSTVRSDCWPCAKKQSFYRDSSTASCAAAPVVAAPFLFKPTALVGLSKSSLITAPGEAVKNLRLGRFSQAAPPQTKPFFVSTLNTSTNTESSSKPVFPVVSASAVASEHENEAAMSVKKSFSPCNTSPIVMHSTPSFARLSQSPPFTFTELAGGLTIANTSRAQSTDIDRNKPSWVCSVCKKLKDLSGDHLKGKTTVRSDCWPCGKKRNFVLSTSESCGLTDSFAFLSQAVTNNTVKMATKSLLCGARKDDGVVPSESSNLFSKEALWQHPQVPESDSENNIFIPQPDMLQAPQKEKKPLQPSAILTSVGSSVTMSFSPTSFEGEVLRGYRQQLVDGIRTRTAWHNRTLYVIVSGSSKNRSEVGSTGVSHLGQAAVVFLAVEHKMAQSPFRLMRRLFCPDEFIFAAACMYANTFLAGHHTSPQQSSFVVYGPQVDPTVPLTQWGSIINQCAYAMQLVVSGEQRVEGAQSIFSRTGWLTLPLHATAEAIRLAVEQENYNNNNNNNNGNNNNDDNKQDAELLGVDVVLVAETMKLEELPQAAALALPVKPFLK